MGTVYVFNVTFETMNLNLNGMPAATISGWSQYQPQVAGVPRAANPDPGQFCNGANHLTIQSSDGTMANAALQIDGNTNPVSENLLLFITRNTWRLVNAYGTEIGGGQVTRSGYGE